MTQPTEREVSKAASVLYDDLVSDQFTDQQITQVALDLVALAANKARREVLGRINAKVS